MSYYQIKKPGLNLDFAGSVCNMIRNGIFWIRLYKKGNSQTATSRNMS